LEVLETSHQGATLPTGFLPATSSMSPMHFFMTSSSCCGVMATGFSCE
jgi:hypothetical protein